MTTHSDKHSHGPAVRKGAVLIVACVASFITAFMGSAVNIALPAIAEDFQIDAVTLSWIQTSFLLSAAMLLVPFGRYADIRGRRRVFLWGMVLNTLSTLACALAPDASVLIAARVLQGAGSAMIFGTGTAILISVYPLRQRGRVLGVTVATVYLGLSVGPFAGGLLTQGLGWRSVFFTVVPLGVLAIALTLVCMKGEWADARDEKFDLPGSLIFSLGLALTMYGLSLVPSLAGALLLAAGFAALSVFVYWELRTAFPVLDIRLFRSNPVFALSNLSALINYSATFAVTFLMSLYLQYIKGMGPREAGIVMVSQPLVMALFSPLAGRLSDRLEPRLVASLGMALTALGLGFCALLENGTGMAYVVACLMTLGLGFAFFSSPNTNAVMSSVERRHYGLASGTVGTMRLSGQMFSMGIATMILALYVGRNKITPELFAAYLHAQRTAYVFFALLCAVGVFTSVFRGRVRQPGTEAAHD